MDQNKSATRLFYTDESAENYVFMWLTGIQPSSWWLLVDEDDSSIHIRCLLDSRYGAKTLIGNMQELQKRLKTEKVVTLEKIIVWRKVSELLEEICAWEVIIEKSLPYGVYEFISGLSFDSQFDTKAWQTKRRASKTEAEIWAIQKAIALTHQIREEIEWMIDDWSLIGMTELALRGKMIARAMSLGATDEAFDMIVATGKNSAIPHHRAGESIIQPWPLLVDMGWIIHGYCSDMTRTYRVWSVDDTSTEWVTYDEFEESLEAVQKSHALWCEKAVAGAAIGDVCVSARKILGSRDEYFTHSLWHGLGVQVHEYPGVHNRSDVLLESWMVITIEPGVYYDWQYWIRREDTIVVA